MATINWGIIGIGRFGAIHASVISSLRDCQLTAICNRNSKRLAAAAAEYPHAFPTESFEELLNREDIDAVSITTRWQDHFTPARAAILAGKHVLLEKPMAATPDECSELCRLAADHNTHLMVGHVCRFDPKVTMAREAIQNGEIGRIVSMHAKRNLPLAPGHIRLDKISPLMGDGVHDADLMMWFTGQRPTRVYAKNISAHDYTFPDLGWALLDFDDDAVGVIETNWCLPKTVATTIDAQFQIVGTEGMLTIDCANTGLTRTNASGTRMFDTTYWPKVHGHHVGALRLEFEYFVRCIQEHAPPAIVTPQDGWAAVTVVETAERSAAAGLPLEFNWDTLK